MPNLMMVVAVSPPPVAAAGGLVEFPWAITVLQGTGLFVRIPALVMLLIALPIFGPVWWQRVRGHRPGTGRSRTIGETDVARAGGNAEGDSHGGGHTGDSGP